MEDIAQLLDHRLLIWDISRTLHVPHPLQRLLIQIIRLQVVILKLICGRLKMDWKSGQPA